jgi:hypothetical protein
MSKPESVSTFEQELAAYRRRRHWGIWLGLVGGGLVIWLSSWYHSHVAESMLMMNITHSIGSIQVIYGFYEVVWRTPPRK